MNTRTLIFAVILSCISLSSQAGELSDNPFAYSRLTEGEKVGFKELDKKYLGRQCTVYMKPGFPKGFIGGVMPTGAFITDPHTKQNLWIGELYALSEEGIRLRWFYDAARTSSTEYGAIGTEIDYVIVKSIN
jgi:hypothetical protein